MEPDNRTYRALVSIFRQSGIGALEALDALEANRADWLPDGYQIVECGCCGRSSPVPTGASLKKIRLNGLCTQADVAAAAGVGKPSICDVERGRRNPSEAIVAGYYAAVEAKKRSPERGTP